MRERLDTIFIRHAGNPWSMHLKIMPNFCLMRIIISAQGKIMRKSRIIWRKLHIIILTVKRPSNTIGLNLQFHMTWVGREGTQGTPTIYFMTMPL